MKQVWANIWKDLIWKNYFSYGEFIHQTFGISLVSIFNVYVVYVDRPFNDCFMALVMYILDVFIARMAFRRK